MKKALNKEQYNILRNLPDSELLLTFPKEEFGYKRDELRKLRRELREEEESDKELEKDPKITSTFRKNKATFNVDNFFSRDSDEDIIQEVIKLCKINLDEWEIEKAIVKPYNVHRKKFDQDMKWEDGKIVRGSKMDKGEFTIATLFSVTISLRKKFRNDNRIKDELLEQIKKYASSVPAYPKLKIKEDPVIMIVNAFDMHFDKIYNENDSVERAEKLFFNSILTLVYRAQTYKGRISKVYFPIGNDWFNEDYAGRTTKGTPQASDPRRKLVFARGWEILIKTIDFLSNEFKVPIIIPVILGNHDEFTSFYMGEVMKAYYKDNKNIVIDNNPKTLRKYYLEGSNLIGFDHGKEHKPQELHRLMSLESGDKWSKSTFRYFYCGHKHNEHAIAFLSTQDTNGVLVKYMPALSDVDTWHFRKGYAGNVKGCKAVIHSLTEGLIDEISHNIGLAGVE